MGVSLPRKPEVKQVYLTEQQLAALAEECGDRDGIVLFLGTTGLRWGELAGLQVGDVPDVGNRIKLVRTVTWTGGSFEAGVLKGRESRVVSVPASVMEWVRGVAAGRGLTSDCSVRVVCLRVVLMRSRGLRALCSAWFRVGCCRSGLRHMVFDMWPLV